MRHIGKTVFDLRINRSEQVIRRIGIPDWDVIPESMREQVRQFVRVAADAVRAQRLAASSQESDHGTLSAALRVSPQLWLLLAGAAQAMEVVLSA